MVAEANHRSVGEAVAAAERGTRTRLQASVSMSLERAHNMALQLLSDWGISSAVSVRIEAEVLKIEPRLQLESRHKDGWKKDRPLAVLEAWKRTRSRG